LLLPLFNMHFTCDNIDIIIIPYENGRENLRASQESYFVIFHETIKIDAR